MTRFLSPLNSYLFFLLLLPALFKFTAMNAQQKQGQSAMSTVSFRLKPGDDLKASIEKYITDNNIKAGCIITCVGSLQQFAIRYADQKETTVMKGRFEIVSLAGTLSVNGSHLHISVSDESGKTIGGHLKEGSLIYTTAEIVIGILPDVTFEREVDSTYGYKELIVK